MMWTIHTHANIKSNLESKPNKHREETVTSMLKQASN